MHRDIPIVVENLGLEPSIAERLEADQPEHLLNGIFPENARLNVLVDLIGFIPTQKILGGERHKRHVSH